MEVSHPRFNTTEKTKTSKIRNIGASFPALGADYAFLATSLPAGMAVLKKLHKMGNLPADKIELLHKKANDAIKLAGLDKYGVKIKHIKESTVKKPLIKLILNPMEMIEQGLNAAFLGRSAGCFKKNTILMPQKGVSFLAFHEIGHALNHNLSKIGKSLQYLGIPGMIAAVAIGLFGAVTKTSKPQDGKELTGWQKFKDTIKTIAEEGVKAYNTATTVVSAASTVYNTVDSTVKGFQGAGSISEVITAGVNAFNGYGNITGSITSAAGTIGTNYTDKEGEDSLGQKVGDFFKGSNDAANEGKGVTQDLGTINGTVNGATDFFGNIGNMF